MKNITGIILAGGQSRRMGKDKAFITIDEKPLVEIVIDKMLKLFEEVILPVNNPLPYEKYSRRVEIKTDIIPGCGPLGGLYTGLKFSRNEFNVVVACDMPFVNSNLLLYMIEQAKSEEAVVFEWGKKLQPLCSLYRKSCLSALEKQIVQGNFKMRDFLKSVKFKVLKETEVKKFDPEGMSSININTQDEYQIYSQRR